MGFVAAILGCSVCRGGNVDEDFWEEDVQAKVSGCTGHSRSVRVYVDRFTWQYVLTIISRLLREIMVLLRQSVYGYAMHKSNIFIPQPMRGLVRRRHPQAM